MSRPTSDWSAIAKDKQHPRMMHYFLARPYEEARQKREHLFKGTTCWCKPHLRTDWSLMQTGNQVYIYIEHEGAHGPTTDGA